MEKEIWQTYPEINWIQGSNLGNAKILGHYTKTKKGKLWVPGHVLKQSHNRQGYMFVQVSVNGKPKSLLVHRVIASCFLPNPDNFPHINHKNCVRDDNRVENLEWCTPQYNNAYREKYGVPLKESVPKKPLLVVNVETQEVRRFSSKKETSQVLGANVQIINKVVNGQRDTIGRYWITNADGNAIDDAKDRLHKIIGDKINNLIAVTNDDTTNRFVAGCSHYEIGTVTESVVPRTSHKKNDLESVAKKPLFLIDTNTSEVFWIESQTVASEQLNVNVTDIKNVIDGFDRTIGRYYLINDDEDAVEIAKAELPYVVAGGLDYLSSGDPDDERAFDFVVDCVKSEFDLRNI